MPRLTDIESILFPIGEEALFSEVTTNGRSVSRRVPSHKAIVNRNTGELISVVGKDYRIVTNADAVKLGRQCARVLFGLDATAELEVFNVDAPSTGSYCYIDLVHPGFTLNLFDSGSEAEVYVPYVRVTNSYNKARALRFDVGFCRKICLNGMIFERETIRFYFSHLRHEVEPSAIRFDIHAGRLQELMASFKSFTLAIRDVKVSVEQATEIVERVLSLPNDARVRNEEDRKRRDEMVALREETARTIGRYLKDLGPNAYAVFNAMSDLATHLRPCRVVARDANTMQRATGDWLRDFHRTVVVGGANVGAHLLELRKGGAVRGARFAAAAGAS